MNNIKYLTGFILLLAHMTLPLHGQLRITIKKNDNTFSLINPDSVLSQPAGEIAEKITKTIKFPEKLRHGGFECINTGNIFYSYQLNNNQIISKKILRGIGNPIDSILEPVADSIMKEFITYFIPRNDFIYQAVIHIFFTREISNDTIYYNPEKGYFSINNQCEKILPEDFNPRFINHNKTPASITEAKTILDSCFSDQAEKKISYWDKNKFISESKPRIGQYMSDEWLFDSTSCLKEYFCKKEIYANYQIIDLILSCYYDQLNKPDCDCEKMVEDVAEYNRIQKKLNIQEFKKLFRKLQPGDTVYYRFLAGYIDDEQKCLHSENDYKTSGIILKTDSTNYLVKIRLIRAYPGNKILRVKLHKLKKADQYILSGKSEEWIFKKLTIKTKEGRSHWYRYFEWYKKD